MILTDPSSRVVYCQKNQCDDVEPGFIRCYYYRTSLRNRTKQKTSVDILSGKNSVDSEFIALLSSWNVHKDWVYGPANS